VQIMARWLSTILLLGIACDEPMHVAISADLLVAEAQALHQEAEASSMEEALSKRLTSGALMPVPGTFGDEDVAAQLLIAEVATSEDFGYTVSAWPAGDSLGWQVLVWRRQLDASWKVEATARTLHPGPMPDWELVSNASLGWVRARRQLYQEAARVAMLKADRDLARRSTDAEDFPTLAEVLADTALHLQEGYATAQGRYAATKQLQALEGMRTWVPASGAIAAAGDLGYTYGLQTIRPLLPDTTLRTSAYLRIWRAQPDSTWTVILNVLGAAP